MRLNPLDPEIYWSEMYLAYAHLFLGRHDEALGWATERLHIGPIIDGQYWFYSSPKRSREMLREPARSFPS